MNTIRGILFISTVALVSKQSSGQWHREQQPARLYHHPYMSEDPQNFRWRQQQQPVSPAQTQISERKLLMPIISEGYASTKIQGGTDQSSGKKTEEPVKSTTVKPVTTKITTTTTTSRPEPVVTTSAQLESIEPISSPYLPELPSLDDSPQDGAFTSEIFEENPYIIRDDPVSPSSSVVPAVNQKASIRPILQPSQPTIARIDETHTEEDVIDTHSGSFVKLVAHPPQHVKIVSNAPAEDQDGFYKPTASAYSNTYLAGYEQIDFPEQGPGSAPEFQNPDDYHQDRPSFQASKQAGNANNDYFPLGKPPPPPSSQKILVPPQAEAKIFDRPDKKRPSSSFFDFLIPSFVRSTNKVDPEGPALVKPPPPAFPAPNNRPPLKRQQAQQANNYVNNNNAAPPAPGVPDFSNFPHLKTPNRPINTFPPPHELGGKLNPIIIRMPEGYAGGAEQGIQFPQPPGFGLKRMGQVLNTARNEIEQGQPRLPAPKRPPYFIGNQFQKVPAKPVQVGGDPLGSEMSIEEYKRRLQDPNFHQNLTKAIVYHHHTSPDDDNDAGNVDREDQFPSFTKSLLSYLQDANPFNFITNKRKEEKVDNNNSNSNQELQMAEMSNGGITFEDLNPKYYQKSHHHQQFQKPEVVYEPYLNIEKTFIEEKTSTSTTTTTTTTEPIEDYEANDETMLESENELHQSIPMVEEESIYHPEMHQFDPPVHSFDFEHMFIPSKQIDEADWFVLNKNGTRQMIKQQNDVEEEEETTEEPLTYFEYDDQANTERNLVGDFEPMSSQDIIYDTVE